MTRHTNAVTQGTDVVAGVGLGDGGEDWVIWAGLGGLGRDAGTWGGME